MRNMSIVLEEIRTTLSLRVSFFIWFKILKLFSNSSFLTLILALLVHTDVKSSFLLTDVVINSKYV